MDLPMKRWTGVLLAAMLVLTGCGDGDESSAVSENTTTEAQESKTVLDVSGEWTFTISGKEPPSGSLVLTQKDRSITGTLSHGDIESPLEGTIEGTAITMKVQDGKGMVTEAVVAGNSMLGTWKDNEGGAGIWDAMR